MNLRESLNSVSAYSQTFQSAEQVYVYSMTQLRETVLIRKGFISVMLPMFLAGVLGCYYPFVYASLPVHESDLCICSYYQALHYGSRDFFILKSNSQYRFLQLYNTTMFFVINWLFLVILILMIYRIRHVNDETLIKRECALIVSNLVLFSLL